MALLVSNVLVGEGEVPPDTEDCARVVADHLGVARAHVRTCELVRRSLDARSRPPAWRANFKVELERDEDAVLRRGVAGVRRFGARDEARMSGHFPVPTDLDWRARPIVVGAGPAGLFAALRLGEAGAPAVLLERGAAVEDRVPVVNRFWRGGPIDADNNILFGEGGAGTFSDGKIYTRRRDGELGWVFRALVEAGADEDILLESWAHLGTDKVRAILPALRARLRALGVEVRFGAAAEGFVVRDGRCVGVRLRDGTTLLGGPVVVAAGHSARDTLAALLDAGAVAELRPIAIGARIEHPQAVIDAARYRGGRGDRPPASYRLADTPPAGRAAYTFCMCPGGMVVPAQEQDGRVVVNGMSFAARRAMWANSALIVQVGPEDYGATDALAGVRYQDAIERAAYAMTGGFAAPAQRVADFLNGRPSEDIPRLSYPFGGFPTDLARLLPAPVVEGMRRAIRTFDKEVPGFAGAEGVLIAPETRTTAPLRFLRGPNLESTSLPGLLPVGEGAGWAGGIVSAALDGFRAAEAIIAAAPRA